ncbi:hypothetical protein ES703_80079 [subsurface metagenome]
MINVFHTPILLGKERLKHQTQKPEVIIEKLIMVSSNPNDLILDPFLGSGTTAWCAKKLGRRCIGYEIEERYCEMAANRCRQMVFPLEETYIKAPDWF